MIVVAWLCALFVAEPVPQQPPPPSVAQPRPEPIPSPQPAAIGESGESEESGASGKNNLFRQAFRVSGYVQPQYTFRSRPGARPRDRQELGASATRAGILFEGEPVTRWSYTVHLVFGAALIDRIANADAGKTDGPGGDDYLLVLERQTSPGFTVERLAVEYEPVRFKPKASELVRVRLSLGQMRIPFTAQNRSQNFALMFPRRSTTNNVFLLGTDLGAQANAAIWDERFELSFGVYNGTGLAVSESNERGTLLASRVDIQPLGGFPYSEGDLDRGPFRLGVGAGLLYYPSRNFDNSGEDTTKRSRDLRASASLRLAVRGFYVQSEFLRRQRTDNLTNRPLVATGAYAQTSYFIALPATPNNRFGLAPAARFGWTELDQRFAPRAAMFTETGMLFYIGNDERPDVIRILAQYQGEWRKSEAQQAHGATVQVQVRF